MIQQLGVVVTARYWLQHGLPASVSIAARQNQLPSFEAAALKIYNLSMPIDDSYKQTSQEREEWLICRDRFRERGE